MDNRTWDEPARGYWRALGKFIHQFSQTERVVLMTLEHFSKVEGTMAGALFSGLRADACKDAINRILEATGNKAAAERLRDPFQQLGIINGARNNIVHWGAYLTEEDKLVAINDFVDQSDRKVRTIAVSCKMLDDMTFDLLKIDWHLIMETIPKKDLIYKKLMQVCVAYLIACPWQYKPPPQSPHEKARLQNRQVRRRLPSASPEKP